MEGKESGCEGRGNRKGRERSKAREGWRNGKVRLGRVFWQIKIDDYTHVYK